jgi:hypothetical protein
MFALGAFRDRDDSRWPDTITFGKSIVPIFLKTIVRRAIAPIGGEPCQSLSASNPPQWGRRSTFLPSSQTEKKLGTRTHASKAFVPLEWHRRL